MKNNERSVLPDYKKIESLLEVERKTIIKVNSFAGQEDFIRSEGEALLVLQKLESIQKRLFDGFESHPSLQTLFGHEYVSFNEFIQRERILEICFLDDYIFQEKELFPLHQDGEFDHSLLDGHEQFFDQWMEKITGNHTDTQEIIKDKFDITVRSKDLPCSCTKCFADYRSRLRHEVYTDCISRIDQTKVDMEDNLDAGIGRLSDIFYGLKKDLDKTFFKVRHRLKRSSLNRLEGQMRGLMKDAFNYPSPLAIEHSKTLMKHFSSYLHTQGLRSDLVEQEEYDRFFSQMASNIWRNQKYLEREYKKLVNSVLLLKRKDISATILKDYLGEFWLHSDARKLNRKIVYHMGPTNSGKTYHAISNLCEASKGCYLAPLRLLAGELYDTMNSRGVPTTLLTGEEVIETPGATHYSSTIEMARFHESFECCVIDEIQMIADAQRGWAWTRALVNINAGVVHICGDASALELVEKIVELCGDTLEIKNYERMTELKIEKKAVTLGDLQRSDALIVFSRKKALKYKRDLEDLGFKVSIVYGRLSPEVRREQARKFDEGETDIIVSTDAIAMGMNLPIRRIIFSTLSKYINSQEFKITPSEIKQISGRSGRYKRFPTGYVNCLVRVEGGTRDITDAMYFELLQKKNCMVGPDLDIFTKVNTALKKNSLPELKLSEFLRLFNTMTFKKPFYCVELKDMIELAEIVEEADREGRLSTAEIFGFACAPVNLGLLEHVQYYVWILNHFVSEQLITNEHIDHTSDDIDYLETGIKCIELFQWLSRHFNNKNFDFDEYDLLDNKGKAIDKLNALLSDKIVPTCSSCGQKLEEDSQFAICEACYRKRRFRRKPTGGSGPRKKSSKRGYKKRRKR